MYVRHLTLADFRSYETAELELQPGATTLVGLNGQGKTNLVEAIGYVASLSSHRVANDGPLVRFGADRAIIRAAVIRHARETLIELEINPGKANRARLNRSSSTRPKDILGTLRTVLFAPEDLALVKGDPGERRRFLDDLLVARQPRWAGVRSDLDRIVKQRNALLKSAAPVLRRNGSRRSANPVVPEDESLGSALHTLDIWDQHLATVGAQLLYARLRLLRDLGPHLTQSYGALSGGITIASATYRASLLAEDASAIAGGEVPDPDHLTTQLLAALTASRTRDIERGLGHVGPHRDDLLLNLGDLPAKGYASHGESWSVALGLRLAAYRLLSNDLGDDPVLILDDVFAELDAARRDRLAELIRDCEQVIITAAVPEDVPDALTKNQHHVKLGEVTRAHA